MLCRSNTKTKKYSYSETHLSIINHFLFVSSRGHCNPVGLRNFLWTTMFTWAETWTLKHSDRSTCTGSSDLDWSDLDWIGLDWSGLV